jgi:hypothetical protein
MNGCGITSIRGVCPATLAALAAASLVALTACQSQPPVSSRPTEATAPPRAASGSTVSSGTAPAEASVNRPASATDAGPLAPLAWLEGCWQGTVNQREFREQWLPLRGAMLIGASQQVSRDRTQDYEFMRLDARADGIHFTQFSGDRKETSFKLTATTTDDKDTIFTFANTVDAFPARLIYRRGADGWLYETIEGPLNGSDKRVIYPFRRIDCESGELILK